MNRLDPRRFATLSAALLACGLALACGGGGGGGVIVTECNVDEDCSDAVFCNGAETCNAGMCVAGTEPCVGQVCVEATSECVACTIDQDCDDTLFCNGAETCNAGMCVTGTDPCMGDEVCLEATDVCVPPTIFTAISPAGDLSMAAGNSNQQDFDVVINVNNVADFFGASFHVTFDSASADFMGHSSAGTILPGGSQFQAALVAPGEVAVTATMVGESAGLPNGNGLLITLQFEATNPTAGANYTFEPTASRRVDICPTQGQACTDEAGSLSWTGGTLLVN